MVNSVVLTYGRSSHIYTAHISECKTSIASWLYKHLYMEIHTNTHKVTNENTEHTQMHVH